MSDDAVQKASFLRWRYLLLASMFCGYSSYYMVRKSYTFSMHALLKDEQLKLSKADLGMIASSMMAFYTIGKFLCGILSDKLSPRKMFATGLFISGVLNALFGTCSTTLWFSILWGMNGFFQGFGWAPCAKLIKSWYKPEEVKYRFFTFSYFQLIIHLMCNVDRRQRPL